MLSSEQISQIKQQIIQQINSNFPEDKKEFAKQQIESMDVEQLEEFLKKNKLIQNQDSPSQTQCIFCSIISGDVQSYKIDENEKAIAILEINPISKGHSLIIPKEHISSKEKIQKEILSLSEKISKKIKLKLKPKEVLVSKSNLFGHEIINLLPIYKNETINSERKQAKPEELENLKNILKEKPKKKIIKKPKTKRLESKKLWLPKRIP